MNKENLRLVIFLVVVAFIMVGPAYRQVFGGQNRVFRNWIMFSRIGLGDVDARFTQLHDNGAGTVLDRREVLAGRFKKSRRSNVWLIRLRRGGAVNVAKQLCEVLGPEVRIKIDSRVATRTGWKPYITGRIVECDKL